MFIPGNRLLRARPTLAILGAVLAGLLIPAGAVQSQPGPNKMLHIGASRFLGDRASKKEKAATESLQAFIKEETGFENDIARLKDWRELADKMAKGELPLGVFPGYEFAWAQEKYPALKPLALAVNVHVYQTVHIVVRKDNKAKELAELQGQALALPPSDQGILRLFLNKETKATGKQPEDFFGKIAKSSTVEDAVDDVVDGVVAAAAVDRAGLEAYKRRKPGRFNQLKELAKSPPFPPIVIACYDDVLDKRTQQLFQSGLLRAHTKEKGQTLLTLFRLTAFQDAPADFERVLAEVRKTYRPEDEKK